MKASILILLAVLGLFAITLMGCQSSTSEEQMSFAPNKPVGWEMTPAGVEVPKYSQTQ